MKPSPTTASERVRVVMRAINQAWVNGTPEQITAHLHPDAVMLLPGFAQRIRGRDAIVDTYREFLANATLEGFTEGEYEIDVVGSTAILGYAFEVQYMLTGRRYGGHGHDLWGFAEQDGMWRAMWRIFATTQEQELMSDPSD